MNIVICVALAFVGVVSADRSTWMQDFSNGNVDYGFDLYSKTIFDIMWPGSTNVGMYESNITITAAPDSSNEYGTALAASSATDPQKVGWSERQSGSVLDQLNHGARFLQMQFEFDGTNYYSYNGYYGATADVIAADIASFISGKTELIVIYFNNFIAESDSNDELTTLFGIFETALGSAMAEVGTYDLTSDTIQTMVDAGVRVIAFAEDTGSGSSYVNDDSSLTTYDRSGNVTTYADVRSRVISEIREGWDFSQLFLLYWTVDVADIDGFTFISYDGFYEYTKDTEEDRDMNFVLSDFIESFPKLRFGNVILVDYFEGSDVYEQIIRLNYEYGNCNDNDDYWGTDSSDCPAETNLRNEYATSGQQSECDDNTIETNCQRSCGFCEYNSGVPGSECNDDSDCDSPIYQDEDGGTGECFIAGNDTSTFITQSTFCKGIDTFIACASLGDIDVCSNTTIDISTCDLCSSDYQCGTGYCNSEYGVCMTFNSSNAVSVEIVEYDGYDFIKSETAIQFREDIEWLRPGDPDAEYDADFEGELNDPFALMDANPYLSSLIGFIVIPFTLAIFLFLCWSFTCCFWCLPCCEGCCKKCCCRMCLGPEPEENLVAKWLPCGIIGATMIVLIWACIDGIMANSLMHDHVFSEGTEGSDETESVRAELNDLFEEVTDKLGDVGPIANGIIDNIANVTQEILDSLSDISDLNSIIDKILNATQALADDYSGNITLGAEIRGPFYFNTTVGFELACDFCSDVGDTLSELNEVIEGSVTEGLQLLTQTLNDTDVITDATDVLREELDSFLSEITEVVDLIEDIEGDADQVFEDFKPYDEQREFGGFIFFSVPFVWGVFPILGIFLGKWCFKANWCLAMYLGATVMLILSFFAIVSVGWADLCVRLDGFEKELGDSDIGQQIGELYEGNDTALLYQVVNACFYGESLLAIFDLEDTLDFDQIREELADSLDFDVASYFESADFDSFQTELDLLDATTFTGIADESIETLNNVGSSCYCPSTVGGEEFTADLIKSYSCSKNDTIDCLGTDERDVYWCNLFLAIEGGDSEAEDCVTQYSIAYGYVFTEDQLLSDINVYVDGIKDAGNEIIGAFDDLYLYAVGLENTISNIVCLLEPIFDRIDTIIGDYTNCAFIGDAYEGFKEVGCELLFSDMYRITRAMAIIAFLSIMIVFCSMCMDYVKDPACDDDEEDEFGNPAKVGSQTDPYSQQGTEMAPTGSRPSYANGGPGSAGTQPGGEGNRTNFV